MSQFKTLNKNKPRLFCLILLTGSFCTFASDITVAAGWSRPPYIIPDTHSGFELDLITQVLSNIGHEVTFVYVPYERTISMLEQKKIDIALALDANGGLDTWPLSDVFVVYQNVVLSLKENKLEMNNIGKPIGSCLPKCI